MSTSPNATLGPDHNGRRADGEVNEVKAIARHPSLYFEDGNLILSAGHHLFRVHRSVLAKHSPVLCELFDHTHGLLQGCPHIHLNHTSEELAILIQVIYAGCHIRDDHPMTTDTFPKFANILRMTTRYGIDRVAAVIISRIRAEWPSDLAKYTPKGTLAPALQSNPSSVPGPSHGPSPAPTTVHPAAVIAVLRESGYSDPSLLFPLLYALSTMCARSGADAPARHVALLSAEDTPRLIMVIKQLAPRVALLSPEDTARLIVGIEHLRAAHVRLTACPPCPKESAAHWCERGVAELWAWIRWRADLDLEDPIRAWTDVAREAKAPGALAKYPMCAQCAKDVIGYLDGVPGELWRSLPVVFGLAGGSRV